MAKWRVTDPGHLFRLIGEIVAARMDDGEAGGCRCSERVYVIVFKGEALADSAEAALREYNASDGGGTLSLPMP